MARVETSFATEADASAIAELLSAAAMHLTTEHGPGHWTGIASEKVVLRALQTSRVLTARQDDRIVASLRLSTRKPWAIDPKYFTQVRRPLYLLDMAVDPAAQRQGLGRRLLAEAATAARAWPADALRLDSYDATAGAGPFYAKCGFRNVGRVVYRGTPLEYFELLL
jgi:GNAT superfamily N-acetyltransferase